MASEVAGSPGSPVQSSPCRSLHTSPCIRSNSSHPGSAYSTGTPVRSARSALAGSPSNASLFGGSPVLKNRQPSVDVGGLTLPVSAVSTFCNVEASVAGANWQYVGEGHGGYAKVQKYRYVGVGGDWEKEVTEIPTNWRLKKVGFFILALLIVGPLVYLGSGLVIDDTEEEQNAVAEKVLIGPPSRGTLDGSAKVSNQRQGPEMDCTVGMFNWRQWHIDKKQVCCRTHHIGCEKEDPFDCELGRVNWRQSWLTDKKAWCCKEKQVGCASQKPLPDQVPFDCNEDYVSCYHCLLKRWSDAKREWCCHHGGRGCPTPPPPPPRQPPIPLRAMTPPGLITLPPGTPPPPQALHPFAATKPPLEAPATAPMSSTSTTATTNSQVRHDYAATKPPPEVPGSSTIAPQAPPFHMATAPPPSPVQTLLPPPAEAAAASSALFRPDLAEAHPAETTTTSAKSAKEAALAARSFPFTCTVGLSNWERGWSLRKKAWCCQHEQRGCPPADKHLPYNCEDGYRNCHHCMQDRWSNKKKAWCCQHDGTGCPNTALG
mmetsp:Transcript_71339/g.137763  ORF Transcript_71339/g.137763 Transcript_71339/m.137763 type:complete len:544 (-) Transcript_71339:149-1780(-)